MPFSKKLVSYRNQSNDLNFQSIWLMYDTSFYINEFRNWLYYFHFTQKQHEKTLNINNMKNNKKKIYA